MKFFLSVLAMLPFMLTQHVAASTCGEMRLIGTADYRYLGFIKLYTARLYSDAQGAEILSSRVSKCLLLDYDLEIRADQIVEAANAVLSRQLDLNSLERLTPQISELHSSYQTVSRGDSYSLRYDSESQTTSLSLNAKKLVSIQSPEFARAYFSIWLGSEKPINENLRDSLFKDHEQLPKEEK